MAVGPAPPRALPQRGNGWPPTAWYSRPPGCHRHGTSVTRAAPPCHRGAPAWVVPRWSGDSHSLVGEKGATECHAILRARSGRPGSQTVRLGRSRRRAKNGASARRRYAGLLTRCLQVPVALAVAQHLGSAWCGPAVGIGRKPFPTGRWSAAACVT